MQKKGIQYVVAAKWQNKRPIKLLKNVYWHNLEHMNDSMSYYKVMTKHVKNLRYKMHCGGK